MPGHVRQPEVDEDDVRLEALEDGERLASRRGRLTFVPEQREEPPTTRGVRSCRMGARGGRGGSRSGVDLELLVRRAAEDGAECVGNAQEARGEAVSAMTRIHHQQRDVTDGPVHAHVNRADELAVGALDDEEPSMMSEMLDVRAVGAPTVGPRAANEPDDGVDVAGGRAP